MSQFEVVIHHHTAAPLGLVAIFVERSYVVEPSVIKTYREEIEALKLIRRSRVKPGENPNRISLSELTETPPKQFLERFVTLEKDVVAFGTYDLIQSEDGPRPSPELTKQRKAGALVMFPDTGMVPVEYIEDHIRDLVFLGLELNGKPYGTRYHLNARTDLGPQAPYGFAWMDNKGALTAETPIRRTDSKFSKLPTLYPMGDHERPLEEGSQFLDYWEAMGADVDEYYYVHLRHREKVAAEEREHELKLHPPIQTILEDLKEQQEGDRKFKLAAFKAKLEKEHHQEYARRKADLEAQYAAALKRESEKAHAEREASKNSKLD